MSSAASPETRTSVSSKSFSDDTNLNRQQHQSSTPVLPRYPGEPGVKMIALALWIGWLAGTLAAAHEALPEYVDSRESLSLPTQGPWFSQGDEFFPEPADPHAIDLAAYRRVKSLLNAPYASIDFPPTEF